MKEYSLQEVFNFPNNTEFAPITPFENNVIVKDEEGIYGLYEIKNNTLELINVTKEWVNARFILIKKSVTFEEVLNSDKLCRIEHKLLDASHITLTKYYGLSTILGWLVSWFNSKQIKDIIKNGKWYLEEDN